MPSAKTASPVSPPRRPGLSANPCISSLWRIPTRTQRAPHTHSWAEVIRIVAHIRTIKHIVAASQYHRVARFFSGSARYSSIPRMVEKHILTIFSDSFIVRSTIPSPPPHTGEENWVAECYPKRTKKEKQQAGWCDPRVQDGLCSPHLLLLVHSLLLRYSLSGRVRSYVSQARSIGRRNQYSIFVPKSQARVVFLVK